jgi:hypothetical protein
MSLPRASNRKHDAELFLSQDAAEYATYHKAPAHYQ